MTAHAQGASAPSSITFPQTIQAAPDAAICAHDAQSLASACFADHEFPPVPIHTGTFEGAAIVHPGLRGELCADALLTSVQRARAALLFIMSDGEDLQTGFTLRHDLVLTALDGVDGYLKQAEMLIESSMEKPVILEGAQ